MTLCTQINGRCRTSNLGPAGQGDNQPKIRSERG